MHGILTTNTTIPMPLQMIADLTTSHNSAIANAAFFQSSFRTPIERVPIKHPHKQ